MKRSWNGLETVLQPTVSRNNSRTSETRLRSTRVVMCCFDNRHWMSRQIWQQSGTSSLRVDRPSDTHWMCKSEGSANSHGNGSASATNGRHYRIGDFCQNLVLHIQFPFRPTLSCLMSNMIEVKPEKATNWISGSPATSPVHAAGSVFDV